MKKKVVDDLASAIQALIADREYQKLHGWPHFTSAPTEMEWKADSAKKAWKAAEAALSAWREASKWKYDAARPRFLAAERLAEAIIAVIPENEEDDDRSDALLRHALSAWREASK